MEQKLRDQQIIQQYCDGNTIDEIGRVHGLSRGRVQQILAVDEGVIPDLRRAREKAMKDIYDVYIAGHSVKQIATWFGVGLATVYRMIHRFHSPPRKYNPLRNQASKN